MAAQPRFDIVFNRFYENEPDLVRGFVAYGLYKLAKREWTTEFHGRTGVEPDRHDIDAYTNGWTASMIAGKQTEADAILRDYGRSIVSAEKPDIVEDALRGSAVRSVVLNICSAFLYTLILIGIVVVLRRSGVDLLSLASSKG